MGDKIANPPKRLRTRSIAGKTARHTAGKPANKRRINLGLKSVSYLLFYGRPHPPHLGESYGRQGSQKTPHSLPAAVIAQETL